jgi:hypothetical protein
MSDRLFLVNYVTTSARLCFTLWGELVDIGIVINNKMISEWPLQLLFVHLRECQPDR